MYFTGPHKPMQPMGYPSVVGVFTRDFNANSGAWITGGTLREVTVFDDGAVGVKRYVYGGVATPSDLPGLSDMDSAGGVKSGHVYAEAAAGYFWGKAKYWRVGHLEEDGMTTQSGPASPGYAGSFYYVVPYPVSCEIIGAVPGHWYGPEYLGQ